MTNISKKILFFGTEDFSAIALKGLIEAGFSISAVVTKPDTKRGRRQEITKPAVKLLAETHAIPVWQPTKLSEIKNDISALGDVAGVLVSYGKIIPQSILDLFNPGIINLHPSLLPIYRGPSPVESAMLSGDTKTGISIMQLTAAMDAGPVYHQEVLPLHGNESRVELYKTLGKIGTDALIQCLPDILAGALQPYPQDNNAATYCNLLSKADAVLSPSDMTAEQAEAHIRAYLGFPGSRHTFGDLEAIITKAHVSLTATKLSVRCKDGKYLAIDSLKPLGKKEMPVQAFLAGHKDKI